MRRCRRISILESKHSAVGYDTIVRGGFLFTLKRKKYLFTEQIGVYRSSVMHRQCCKDKSLASYLMDYFKPGRQLKQLQHTIHITEHSRCVCVCVCV